ncbi:hypothetical protein PGT21_007107 [Puccinia graminis f. sp. tritici]|uniref:Uncharacterized protein n=1 Tax=Puccinia graminis f. sp. tritici TaxID=56615 RepID=A0A5B0QA20_PUCGR|nr:hypothetical protein PGT21_007107 [Puccinia graminis f. sp. tritici]
MTCLLLRMILMVAALVPVSVGMSTMDQKTIAALEADSVTSLSEPQMPPDGDSVFGINLIRGVCEGCRARGDPCGQWCPSNQK